MAIFDTHSHYNLEPFFKADSDSSWQVEWQKSQDHGVVGSVVVGTTSNESSIAITIAAADPRLGAAIGIHPMEFNRHRPPLTDDQLMMEVQQQVNLLEPLMKSEQVVAIGETGLDYFHFDGFSQEEVASNQRAQQFALREHLKLAAETLPLLLHVRDRQEEGYWDVLNILQAAKYSGPFVLHCVSGPLAYVHQALDMGAYISVAGNVTYKNAEHLRDIVRMTPADRLLVETDAPFLPPVPFRGKQCEPWMISQTVEFLATELDIQPAQLLENSYRLFPTLQPTA